MALMLYQIIRIDKNIIKINYNANIKKVQENIIYELVKGYQGISKSKRYNRPLKRAIASLERSFPFVTFSNSDQVISISEIYLGIDVSFARGVKEISYQWIQISVFLGNTIKSTKIHIQLERSILFLDEENRCFIEGGCWSDEVCSQIFINKIFQSFLF